jgi:hypothetical protein
MAHQQSLTPMYVLLIDWLDSLIVPGELAIQLLESHFCQF